VTRHRTLLLAAATLLVGGAALAVSATSRDDTGTAVDAAGPVRGLLERCRGDLHCVETATADLVTVIGAVDVARAAADVYRADPALAPECHTYMHFLGGRLSPVVEEGPVPALGDVWTACGAGLVHGVFAAIPLDGRDRDRIVRIVGICDGPEFAEPLGRHHSCLHAVGHGIHAGNGDDLQRAEAVCADAVPAQESFARNDPCLGGVYMADRDTRVANLPVPADAAGWTALLGHCATSPRPDVCTSSYFELSTRHGTTSALSYLDWCLTVGAERECLRQLGQGGTLAELAGSGELAAGTCAAAAAERGLDGGPCSEGVRDALLARGTPPERLDAEACRLVDGPGGRCAD